MPAASRKPAAKPAARKTTTRRRTPAKPAPKPEHAQVEVDLDAQTVTPVYTQEEKDALLLSYQALKAAGIPVPAEVEGPVNQWIEEETARREAIEAQRREREEAMAAVNAAGPWYVRNLTNVPFSVRLDRQTESRRIELKARGNPGDMHPLQDDDRKDPVLLRNINIGAVEIVPAGEANEIMGKQTFNMGPRQHTPSAILRNAKGEAYADGAIKTEIEWGQKGITVATLDPAQMQGQISDTDVKRSGGGVQRVHPGQPQVVSEFIPTGGNPATVTGVPQGQLAGTSNTQAKIADDLARRRGLSGPAAGLGGLTVTVAPPVKE
jgi:hypothetical protein